MQNFLKLLPNQFPLLFLLFSHSLQLLHNKIISPNELPNFYLLDPEVEAVHVRVELVALDLRQQPPRLPEREVGVGVLLVPPRVVVGFSFVQEAPEVLSPHQAAEEAVRERHSEGRRGEHFRDMI